MLSKAKGEVQSIVTKYTEYKKGKIPKWQYDSYRVERLKNYDRILGNTIRNQYHGTATSRQAIRIGNAAARQATNIASGAKSFTGYQPLSKVTQRLASGAKYVRMGGVVFGAISLGMSAVTIHEAFEEGDMRTVAVESASTTAGLLVGAGIALTLTGGLPILIFAAAGGAATSWLAGRLTGEVYDTVGKPYAKPVHFLAQAPVK